MTTLAVRLSRSRKRRLLLSTLAPPVLGAELILVLEMLESLLMNGTITGFNPGLPLIIAVGSYIFMGVQTLVAALLMEYVVRPHARQKLTIVLAASILGMLAGASIGALGQLIIPVISGLFTGWLTGLILASTFAEDQN